MQTKHEGSLPEGDMTIVPNGTADCIYKAFLFELTLGHPAFSRPVGTQCNRKFVLPNLQRLGYCQRSLWDKGKILLALEVSRSVIKPVMQVQALPRVVTL